MKGGICAVCAGIIELSAECTGIGETALWSMTPAELSREVNRAEARAANDMRRMDMLAWMIGQYTAMGACAPGRYPEKPCIVYENARDEESMKRLIAGIALRNGPQEVKNYEQCD